MADGAVAQVDGVVGRGDDAFIPFALDDDQGDEVVIALGESRGEGARNGAYQLFEFWMGDTGFSPAGEVDSVGGLGDSSGRGDLVGRPGAGWGRGGCLGRAGIVGGGVGLDGSRHDSLY